MSDVKEMGFHTYLSLLSLASPASLWKGMEAVELLSQSGLTLVSPCVSLLPSSQTRFSWFPVFTPLLCMLFPLLGRPFTFPEGPP